MKKILTLVILLVNFAFAQNASFPFFIGSAGMNYYWYGDDGFSDIFGKGHLGFLATANFKIFSLDEGSSIYGTFNFNSILTGEGSVLQYDDGDMRQTVDMSASQKNYNLGFRAMIGPAKNKQSRNQFVWLGLGYSLLSMDITATSHIEGEYDYLFNDVSVGGSESHSGIYAEWGSSIKLDKSGKFWAGLNARYIWEEYWGGFSLEGFVQIAIY